MLQKSAIFPHVVLNSYNVTTKSEAMIFIGITGGRKHIRSSGELYTLYIIEDFLFQDLVFGALSNFLDRELKA